MRVRRRRLSAGAVLAIASAIGVGSASTPARATTLFCTEGFRAVYLALDPARSQVTPESGSPQPLSGLLRVEAESLPLTGATRFEIVHVDVRSGVPGRVGLDPTVPGAGLGVLRPDRSFLVPTLLLRVSDGGTTQDLALANVAGSVELDPPCANTIVELGASFEVDTLGPEGVLSVALVATPEPGAALLGAAAVLALALCRRPVESSR
jgi:hypothetical protein